ncbi:MAG: rhomboid family intramembrane serine protease [Bacteroidota bacterium]
MSYDPRGTYRPGGFGGFSLLPPVIKKLLIINVAVFVIQMIFDNLRFGDYPGWYVLNRYFALNPIVGLDQAGQPFNFQIWQIFTYQFMHGGFTHLFFNMFMLWMFGMEIENIMGSKKFIFYYLLAGVGAAFFQLFLAPIFSGGLAPTIGASGAVFGIMIAFAMFFPDRMIFLYFLVPVKAKYLIAFLVLIEFMAVGNMSFVAHLAHIGGAVTGFVFILLDRKNHYNIDALFSKFKMPSSFSGKSSDFRRTVNRAGFGKKNAEEATFYDIDNDKKPKEETDQKRIDEILDKISESGYQNLTEEEKRILFEASKKK